MHMEGDTSIECLFCSYTVIYWETKGLFIQKKTAAEMFLNTGLRNTAWRLHVLLWNHLYKFSDLICSNTVATWMYATVACFRTVFGSSIDLILFTEYDLKRWPALMRYDGFTC